MLQGPVRVNERRACGRPGCGDFTRVGYNGLMPPRYAYWTILIDDQPTAFRARDRDELVPTLQQLRRTNTNVVMKWFARGRIWDSPEQAQWASQYATPSGEKRGKDWRPGGQHKDPRARFKRAAKPHETRTRPPRSKSAGGGRPAVGEQSKHGGSRPARARPIERPHDRNQGDRPRDAQPRPGTPTTRPGTPTPRRSGKPAGGGRKPGDRPARHEPGSRRPPGGASQRFGAAKGQQNRTPARERRTDKEQKPSPPARENPRQEKPVERREAEAPPNPRREPTPESPPHPEQIVIKPEPPERG